MRVQYIRKWCRQFENSRTDNQLRWSHRSTQQVTDGCELRTSWKTHWKPEKAQFEIYPLHSRRPSELYTTPSETNWNTAKFLQAGYQEVWRKSKNIEVSRFPFHIFSGLKAKEMSSWYPQDRRYTISVLKQNKF